MIETVVQRYEDEIEAEAAAGMLRANGIEARVRFSATMGMPRSVTPLRVIAPLGGHELVVDESDVNAAVELLDESGAPSARPQRYRWLGLVLIVAFVAPLLVNLIVAAIERLR